MSIDFRKTETTDAPDAVHDGPLRVPWATVVPLAVVLAFADGYWLISLRGAVGAIERSQEPFANWWRESAVAVPAYVVAVLGALTLGMRWFGPQLRKGWTVLATALLVVAAGTLVGILDLALNSVFDYHLQLEQLTMMRAMGTSAEQASPALQIHAVSYGSRWLLLTNLVLVLWMVAMRGGALKVSAIRQSRSADGANAAGTTRSRASDLRLVLAVALLASAAIHAAVIPEHLAEWGAAGAFFILLTAAEIAVAGLLFARIKQRTVLLAAAAISVLPLILWLYSRTAGMPFGPEPGTPEAVGLPDTLACVLEVVSLLAACTLLFARSWPRRTAVSAHVRAMVVVAIVAVTAIGVAGTMSSIYDVHSASGHSTMDMSG